MKVKTAIIGSGNIGTDLMVKIIRTAQHMELAAMVGIDSNSEGLARAAKFTVTTTHKGLNGLRFLPLYKDIAIFFDATSAAGHYQHNNILQQDGKRVIDLTPAAIGPYVVPPVNLNEHLDATNINMVTCGGQATIPIVHAVSQATERLIYAEIVASIASKSAGPGTRANIDEFTQTTAKAIETIGGAESGKAIIILNPAEPPLIMRDTVCTFSQGGNEKAIRTAVDTMVKNMQTYVPGYRLKQDVQFESYTDTDKLLIPGKGKFAGIKSTVFLEVEGAAHYLPSYAGNLDIMTSAAKATGEQVALRHLVEKKQHETV